jgi:mRNA interferase MazF
MVACAITSHTKGYPFEVPFTGKKISGVVLADQIRTLDWSARKVTFAEKVTPQALSEVQRRVEALIFG